MNNVVKQQIAVLQQSVWDLQKAREKIQQAIGASDLGRILVEECSEMIYNVELKIDNLYGD